MKHSDSIEFYLDGSQRPFLTIDSSFQPSAGDLVNIQGCTYTVIGRSFTVDHADSFTERSIRCNVIVKRGVPIP